MSADYMAIAQECGALDVGGIRHMKAFTESQIAAFVERIRADRWQPIESAPKDGTEFLVWFPKVRLDDDENMTDEVIGGAAVITSFTDGSWNDPDFLDAHGSYFLEDWCFAAIPTHWMPLPSAPAAR